MLIAAAAPEASASGAAVWGSAEVSGRDALDRFHCVFVGVERR